MYCTYCIDREAEIKKNSKRLHIPQVCKGQQPLQALYHQRPSRLKDSHLSSGKSRGKEEENRRHTRW